MKRLAIPLLGALAVVSAAPSDPYEGKKELTDQLVQQNFPAFIKKVQSETYLPQKEGFTLKSHKFSRSSDWKSAEHFLRYDVILEDQDKSIYDGSLELLYNANANTSRLYSGFIHTWDNSKSSNKDLPLSVDFKSYSCHEGVNFAHEITDSGILKTVTNGKKVANVVKELSQVLTDVKVSHATFKSLVFDCVYTYFMGPIWVPTISGKVQVSLTGNHKGKEHTYNVDFKVSKKGDAIGVGDAEVSASKEEDICNLLEDISLPKAIKDLQEKNIIPVETLTTKKNKCEEADNSRRQYSYDETHYICYIELVNPQNVSYSFLADASLNRATGGFNYYGKVDFFKWDTSAAKVENNPLFPTEYFHPKFECKSTLLADQKALTFNQEIPVKLFNFVINEKPLRYPEEIVGKKFTVSDIKVRSIESQCGSYGGDWGEIEENALYRLTGVLTTSDGQKWKADLEGKLLAEPFKDEGLLRKAFGHFQSKKDPFYNRFRSWGREVTLIK